MSLLKLGSEDLDKVQLALAWTPESGEKPILTPKQDEIKQRWEDADRLLYRHKLSSVVVKHLVQRHGISLVQAYRDVKHAKAFFGEWRTTVKKYDIQMLMEMQMKVLLIALETLDLNAFNKGMANLIKAKVFEDIEPFDVSQVEIPQRILGKFKEVLGEMPENFEERLKMFRMQKAIELDAEDAEIIE